MVATMTMPRMSSKTGAERRVFPRTENRSTIEGQRLDHTVEARRQPRMMLALRDVSLGGLSAISDMPLAEGEKLAVSFATYGQLHAWDAMGRVIRCEPSSLGYRLAVEFDPMPMAA